MITAQAIAPSGVLTDEIVRTTVAGALSGQLRGQHILILIPDHTRTLPLPFLFSLLTEVLGNARKLDFMVALGTHPPLSATGLCRLVGIVPESYEGFLTQHPNISLFNHAWDNPNALATIGTLTREQVMAIAGNAWYPSLGGDVPVRINKAALHCDHILIVGPTFPHVPWHFRPGDDKSHPLAGGVNHDSGYYWDYTHPHAPDYPSGSPVYPHADYSAEPGSGKRRGGRRFHRR
jgi:nickel-dependent lactate racemase